MRMKRKSFMSKPPVMNKSRGVIVDYSTLRTEILKEMLENIKINLTRNKVDFVGDDYQKHLQRRDVIQAELNRRDPLLKNLGEKIDDRNPFA